MAVLLGRRERGLEPHVDAQLARPVLQDLQHQHAADAGEAVTARHGSHASMDHGDVVPVGEVLTDRGGALRVVALHVAERVVGQHDAPPERGVARVAFEQGHLVGGVAQLHRDREVQPGRTTTQAENLHRIASHAPRSNSADQVCHRAGKYFKLEIIDLSPWTIAKISLQRILCTRART